MSWKILQPRSPSPRPSKGRGKRFYVHIALAALLLGGVLAFGPFQSERLQPVAEGRAQTPPAASKAGGPVENEAYQWRPVAIGGGGYVTGIDIDKSGQTRVIRTDVYGAYRWDAGANRWAQLVTTASMPQAIRPKNGVNAGVYEIAVAPGDRNRVYMVFHDRLFRSDDAGRHWSEPQAGSPFPLKLDPNSEFRLYGPFLAVSPADPDLVFLGTPTDGLLRSRDSGGAWERVDSVPAGKDLRPAKDVQSPGIAVWFDPGRPAAVLASSPGNGVFASSDGGKTFTSLPAGGPTTVMRAAFDGKGRFWATEEETKSAWVLEDGAWRDLTEALTFPKRLWRGVAAGPNGDIVTMSDAGGFLMCSSNGGANWWPVYRKLSISAGDPRWLMVNDGGWFGSGQILLDPSAGNHLWVASGIAPFEATLDACPSSLTWRSLARGIEEIVANDVVHPPGGAPVFPGWDYGIHVKPDLNAFSTSYGPRPRIIIAAQQVDWSGKNPKFLVTNASDTRQCCADDGQSVLAGYSTDGGLNWTRFETLPQPPGTKADDPWRMAYGSIAVSSDDTDNIVWVPGKNRAPFFTLDRGKTWHQVHFPGETGTLTGSFGPMSSGRKSLAADRVRPGTFYIVHNGGKENPQLAGLWRTEDKGTSWRKVFEGEIAPNSAGYSKIRAVPGQGGHLFFTSGVDYGPDQRLRRTRDGGEHWQALDGVEGVDDVGFGKAARQGGYPTIFLTGRVNGRYGAWRSIDDAKTWQLLAEYPLGWLTTVAAVEGDKDVFGRFYVGYVGGGWLYGEPAPCQPGPLGPGDDRQCARIEAGIAAHEG